MELRGDYGFTSNRTSVADSKGPAQVCKIRTVARLDAAGAACAQEGRARFTWPSQRASLQELGRVRSSALVHGFLR